MRKLMRAPVMRPIECPCCHQELSVTTHPGERYSTEMPGPALYWRDDKYLLECRRCQSEIRMSGSGYVYISTMQLSHSKGEVARATHHFGGAFN